MISIKRWGSFLLLSALCNPGLARESPPNVLFIAIDDLNHWVGHLDGHPGTLTPNIDRLAARVSPLLVPIRPLHCVIPLASAC